MLASALYVCIRSERTSLKIHMETWCRCSVSPVKEYKLLPSAGFMCLFPPLVCTAVAGACTEIRVLSFCPGAIMEPCHRSLIDITSKCVDVDWPVRKSGVKHSRKCLQEPSDLCSDALSCPMTLLTRRFSSPSVTCLEGLLCAAGNSSTKSTVVWTGVGLQSFCVIFW